MPDRDIWTSAMVLKWVLTRDQAPVLAMVDTYGAVRVFEDGTVFRLVPRGHGRGPGQCVCSEPSLEAPFR